jgi:ABC-2 type transport system ATP-binding protein
MPAVIRASRLTKRYGALSAVDSLSFEVQEGEIFGMVGPNGAGKTTTIECLEGLRQVDQGELEVLSFDPSRSRVALAELIGIQLQQSNLPARLRVGEAMALFRAQYARRADGDGLLARLGLAEKKRAPIGTLSGGQRQRLFIALALVNEPRLVFFDELTTGLDPQARRSMWDLVREIRDRGCTIFLTTHFMEEAERLCDRVAILDHGTLVALDTPPALIQSLGKGRRLVFTLPPGIAPPMELQAAGVEKVEIEGSQVRVEGSGERFASSVVSAFERSGVPFIDLRTEQPTLEDVFLALTGRQMRE